MDVLGNISEVQRLRLKPGDALVIRMKAAVSGQVASEMIARVRAVLGLDDSVPVLILDADTEIEVVEASDEERIRAAMAEARGHPGRIVTR